MELANQTAWTVVSDSLPILRVTDVEEAEEWKQREQLGSCSSPPSRRALAGDRGPAGSSLLGGGMNPVKPGGTAAEAGGADEATVRLVGPRQGDRRGGSPCRRAALRCGRARVAGDARPRPAPASQGERGPDGPAAPGGAFRCCQGLLHTRVTQPRPFGEAAPSGGPTAASRCFGTRARHPGPDPFIRRAKPCPGTGPPSGRVPGPKGPCPGAAPGASDVRRTRRASGGTSRLWRGRAGRGKSVMDSDGKKLCFPGTLQWRFQP